MPASSKCTIRLSGGLGNQLFQYAFGRAIEIKSHAHVAFDSSVIALRDRRSYELDSFNTKITRATEHFPEYTRMARIRGLFGGPVIVQESNLTFMPSLFERIRKGGTFYLNGYWQTEDYFKDIRSELLTEITLAKPYSETAQKFSSVISSVPAVSIHIRRGDYVTNANAARVHGTCDLEYYKAAVALMQESVPHPNFFVFSDDIDWVRDNLGLPKEVTTYVSGTGVSDVEELMLMSECNHHIIANSSFSWWGAWLNTREDKNIIAPARWFNDPKLDSSHIVPASWIRI